MKKRLLALFLAAALAAGLFSGCRRSNITALYFAVEGAASSFDPQIAAPGAVRIVVRNCFEGLTYVTPAGEAQPAAAERWEVSGDGCTYTFYLRQGAVWHVSETVKTGLAEKLPADFAPQVTAADFVFALRRAVDPNTGAPQAYLLSNIVGAEAVMAGEAAPSALGVRAEGAYKLVIRLVSPEPGFLETLAEPVCMPCCQTFFEATGGRYGLLMKYIISNGPLFLTRFEDNAFRMAKNPDYNGSRAAKTDVIWLYSGVADETLRDNLAKGDYAGAFVRQSPALAAKLRHSSLLQAQDQLRAFVFNPKNEILSNVSVRRAFFAATSVADVCRDAGASPAETFCPASLKGVEPFTNGRNDTAAAVLLRQGLEALEQSAVSLTLVCDLQNEAVLRRLLQGWQKCFGVECTVALDAVTPEELERRVLAGEFDIAFYPVRAAFFSPWAYYAQFSALGSAPLLPLEDAELADAISALRFADANAGELQRQVERLLAAQYVLLPVWQEGAGVVLNRGVRGVELLGGEDRLCLWNAQGSD